MALNSLYYIRRYLIPVPVFGGDHPNFQIPVNLTDHVLDYVMSKLALVLLISAVYTKFFLAWPDILTSSPDI